MPAEVALLALLLPGCIDHLLEAPYVLATGAGRGALAMAPSARQSLLVAGPEGVFEVDGSGAVAALSPTPARGVVGHGQWVAVVDEQGVTFGTVGERTWTPGGRVALPGVRAAQAWCEDQLLVLTGDGLSLLSPGQTAPATWAPAPADAVDLNLAPGPPCAAALVLTPDRLLQVDPQGSRVLAAGLVGARAAAVDRHGQPWVVHGEPPVLARIEGGEARTVARYLGDVTDMAFGTGGLLHGENAYLLTRQGALDYVHVPAVAP